MQGEVLSPILFSFYVNDFEMEFIRTSNMPVEMRDLNLFVLLYADDMILFSETVVGLQNMLHTLSDYSKKWSLEVNVLKTKIVVFRNGGQLKVCEKWMYENQNIEIVDEFNYLGILLKFNGKFLQTQKQLAMQGNKALFTMPSNAH